MLDSELIFFVPVIAYGGSEGIFSGTGVQDGLYMFGTTVYTALVVCMLAKIVTITWTWNAVHIACTVGSLMLYLGYILVYSSTVEYAYDFYGVAFHLLSRGAFWLIVLQVR